ncbi:MAG: DUF1292 domain-containing protein, partial [Lachnospiraceae bacterium]|nr:DUF1292 domain-containing protein [Lachnospiraceae bacterium]
PVDESGNPREELGVLLYRYDEDAATGEPSISDIGSDEEMETASEAYQKLIRDEM